MIDMTGIQYYANDASRTLEQKIKAALESYQKKTGKVGLICLVNEKEMTGLNFADLSKKCGVIVKPTRIVLPNHLWIGEEKEMQI